MDERRIFKTAWFDRAARKARIDDVTLLEAIAEASKGQADDLGGGVFKKRLDANRQRSIILAKGGRNWIYVYLFAKQDRANISERDLKGFRKLAALYAAKTKDEFELELKAGKLMEIFDDRDAQT